MNTKEENGTMDNITCGEGCFLGMNFNQSVTKFEIKDLWSGKSLGILDMISDFSNREFNGILEMQLCTASEDQIFEYYAEQKTIKSMYNDGYLGVYNCDINESYPLVVSTLDDVDNFCNNGSNNKWIVTNITKNIPSYCNDTDCVTICNQNYIDNDRGKDGCLYVDTIKGMDYAYAFWKDGTIREMKSCQGVDTVPVSESDCRCLGIRPFIGQSSFKYVAENVQSQGGVAMLQFSPLSLI